MMKRLPSVFLVLALTLSLPGISGTAISAEGAVAPIGLKAATFVPARGEKPQIAPGLTIAGYAQGQRGYYLVQFRGPVQQGWKDQVSAAGAQILAYVPDFAFKVRMTPCQAKQVQGQASVAWVGLFHPAYKLSPTLKREGTNLYSVRVERGADAGLTAAAVARTGAKVLGREGGMLLVGATSAQIDAAARVLDVAWVENFLLPEKHNQIGAGVIMGSNTANTNGYTGSTQIVAVADTGLGRW